MTRRKENFNSSRPLPSLYLIALSRAGGERPPTVRRGSQPALIIVAPVWPLRRQHLLSRVHVLAHCALQYQGYFLFFSLVVYLLEFPPLLAPLTNTRLTRRGRCGCPRPSKALLKGFRVRGAATARLHAIATKKEDLERDSGAERVHSLSLVLYYSK